MAPVSLWAAGYQKQGRCITLSLPANPKQAKTVRLTIVSDNIIRVEATPEDAIPQKRKSLVVVNREGKYTADVKEDDRMVTVETAAIIANEELFQYNTKVAIPFVVSNKNYGILWDSYSYGRWGNPNNYQQLHRAFKLYDKNGKLGSLTGTYT